jgi:hypothetical protein
MNKVYIFGEKDKDGENEAPFRVEMNVVSIIVPSLLKKTGYDVIVCELKR